ncbi:MAG: hypothetical protein KJO36_04265 [Acidimicrobiia bacterium]|nr:hypothetical protein [Acidimicrobiia bacterium]
MSERTFTLFASEVFYVNEVGIGELIDLGDDRWAFLRYEDAVCEERTNREECIQELKSGHTA